MDTDLAVILAIGAIGTVFFTFIQLREERAAIAIWQFFANERDGRLLHDQCRGLIRRHIPILEVPVDEVLVRVEGISNRWQRRSSFTYIRARYHVSGTGPRFRVARPPLHLRAMRSVEGMRKLAFDAVPDFDRKFTCHCVDADDAMRVLRPELMHRILDIPDLVMAYSDENEVLLGFGYLCGQTAKLDSVVALVADMAGTDLCALESLYTNIPDGFYVPPRGPWDRRSTPRVEVRSPLATIAIQPVTVGKRVVTQVSMDEERPRELLSVSLDADGKIAHVTGDEHSLSGPAVDALRAVGAGTFQVTSARIRFTWTEIETDPGRLAAAIALVRSCVATNMPGVFRG